MGREGKRGGDGTGPEGREKEKRGGKGRERRVPKVTPSTKS